MDAAHGLDVVRPHAPAARWMHVGRCADVDSAIATSTALTAATGRLRAKLLLVFAARSHDLATVARVLRDSAPDAEIAGCATGGELTAHGAGDGSVVVVALGGDGLSISTAAIAVNGSLHEAAADAAASVGDVADRRHCALILLTDGASGDPRDVVRGAYSVAGAAVPLIGGSARPRGRTGPCQIHDGKALADAVIAVAIGSDAPIGVAVDHGWTAVGEPMFVSRTLGTTILTVNEQPALDAYLTHLGAPDEAYSDAAAFTAFAVTHPLGTKRSGGLERVRHVVSADFTMRSLQMQVAVAQGSLIATMHGSAASVLDATDTACGAAVNALGANAPAGLIVFDCVGRRAVLGDAAGAAVARMAQHAGGAPIAGLYTYGEIARPHGVTGYHNQAIAALALA